MHNTAVVSALVVLGFSGFLPYARAADPSGCEAAAREAIRNADVAFGAALAAGDVERFRGFVAEDAVFFGRKVSRGRDEVAKAWSPLMGPGAKQKLKWEPGEVKVSSSCDLGYSIGQFTLRGTDEKGAPVVSRGHYVTTWRKDPDGVWRIVVDIGTQPEAESSGASVQPAAAAASGAGSDGSIPPGEAGAKQALETSPRHGEFVDVKGAGGRTIRTWIVYPERKEKAPVVIVIQEVFGLTDWIRAVADQLAEDGFIAVAPDLLSGRGPGGGGSEAFASRDEVVKAVRSLDPEDTQAQLDKVREWALKLPAASGRSATVGFCWGGARSFAYAASRPNLDAAVVYYGSAPEPESLAKIRPPVLGLYGSDDERVNATIAPTTAEMKRLGRTYETEIYEGAGHGFLRAQDARDGANLAAARKAWPRMLAFLRQHTK